MLIQDQQGASAVNFTIRTQTCWIFLNTMNSELARDPYLTPSSSSPCPFPLSLSSSFSFSSLLSYLAPALNEWCLYWAHRQSISRALSQAAGCLSQTVLEGGVGGAVRGSGGIRGYFRVHLSCTAQSEGAQVRLELWLSEHRIVTFLLVDDRSLCFIPLPVSFPSQMYNKCVITMCLYVFIFSWINTLNWGSANLWLIQHSVF